MYSVSLPASKSRSHVNLQGRRNMKMRSQFARKAEYQFKMLMENCSRYMQHQNSGSMTNEDHNPNASALITTPCPAFSKSKVPIISMKKFP